MRRGKPPSRRTALRAVVGPPAARQSATGAGGSFPAILPDRGWDRVGVSWAFLWDSPKHDWRAFPIERHWRQLCLARREQALTGVVANFENDAGLRHVHAALTVTMIASHSLIKFCLRGAPVLRSPRRECPEFCVRGFREGKRGECRHQPEPAVELSVANNGRAGGPVKAVSRRRRWPQASLDWAACSATLGPPSLTVDDRRGGRLDVALHRRPHRVDPGKRSPN
jgi:hypothetical protein